MPLLFGLSWNIGGVEAGDAGDAGGIGSGEWLCFSWRLRMEECRVVREIVHCRGGREGFISLFLSCLSI